MMRRTMHLTQSSTINLKEPDIFDFSVDFFYQWSKSGVKWKDVMSLNGFDKKFNKKIIIKASILILAYFGLFYGCGTT